jgi:hypothetical protein
MDRAMTLKPARAERRAAPKPARIPRATKGPLPGPGDRQTYSSDEGLS